MGNNQSDDQQQSQHFTRLSELFKNLADAKNAQKIVKKDSFEKYFTFQGSTLLGKLLYKYINEDGKVLDQNEFVKQMENVLNSGSSTGGQIEMYFTLFSNGQDIAYQELCDMVKICYEMWLYLEGFDKSADGPVEGKMNIMDIIVHSMMSDKDSPVSTKQCIEWTSNYVSCLFNPLHSWLVTLLLHGESKLQNCHQFPPIISWLDHPNMILDKHLFWLIAMVLPDHYISVKYDNLWSSHTASSGCMPDKQWTVLYNSIQDGQSFNRFKHHCFSYNGPTVLVIMVESGPIIIAGVDSNWRESSSSWGKSNCMLLQIDNDIKILKEGENMVFLNERTRGFPTGLLLGNGAGKPMVSINIDLTSAILHYKYDITPRNITRLEMWGCSGLVAKEKQKEQQRWERRQAEKLQKVKLPGKWDENPDRAILEMAGITNNDYGQTD